MTYFSVNGKEMELKASPEQSVEELMSDVRRRFNSDQALISSILVNGNELNEQDEAALAGLTVSDIETLEVFTRHPRELAEETLQSLMEFSVYLGDLSRRAADNLERGQTGPERTKLVDGIQTFTEALQNAKQILRANSLEIVGILEADLSSLLGDLLDFESQGQREYAVDLMRTHLPLNLDDWRNQGLPALIRSRDS